LGEGFSAFARTPITGTAADPIWRKGFRKTPNRSQILGRDIHASLSVQSNADEANNRRRVHGARALADEQR